MRFASLSPQHPTQKIVRHPISAAAAPDLHVLLLLLTPHSARALLC